MMDATAVYHPWINATPLAPVANMYRLARGSLRYEFDFQINYPKNTANQMQLTNANIQAFAMFLPKYFPPLKTDGTEPYYIQPGVGFSNYMAATLSYNTGSSFIADNFPLADVSGLFRTGNPYYARFPTADPSSIKQLNYSPYHQMVPLTASSDGFSCSVALEIPFVHHNDAYRIPNQWNNTTPPVESWIADGPIPAHVSTRHNTPYPDQTIFGPAFSPGSIVYGLYNANPLTYSTPLVPMNVTTSVMGGFGDDFRFGCLSNLDYTFLNSQYYTDTTYQPGYGADMFNTGGPSFAATAPPATDLSKLDNLAQLQSLVPRIVSAQGNSTSTNITQNFSGAVSGTVPVNVTGDKWDNKLDLSIPTTGMDKPSCTLQLPMGKMFQFNWRNADTGIYIGERQALCASDTDEARPGDFGTEMDEMAFENIRKIPGIVLNTNWDTTKTLGTSLFQLPISPFIIPTIAGNSGFAMPANTTPYSLTMLANTVIPFLYWRGALRYRFRVFACGFHTGKLFIAVNYHPYRSGQPNSSTGLAVLNQLIPVDFNSALSQYGIYIDLSEENHDVEFEVPYISQDVFTTVNHLNANMRNNTGTISCYVVQPLVAVPGTSTSVNILLEMWAGDDFETHTLTPGAAVFTNVPPPQLG
jgi:hypothetical protein